jgi:ABC-type transporter Mla subunit MlaD
MSAKANFFKIGLFVIGATGALVFLLVLLGAGKLFQSKIVMETYFDESVQGLDVGSKVKYRGVVVGEVKAIGFTYTRYQLDLPMSERLRYVMVEATILPRLIGGRGSAGDTLSVDTAKEETRKGLRVRLAPQGITGTNYLEMDYVDPDKNPMLDVPWQPDNLYIPSAQATVTQFVEAASEIVDRLRKIDLDGIATNLNTLLVTTNNRIAAVDSGKISDQTKQVLGKLGSKLDQLPVDKIGDESAALLAELRTTNRQLQTILNDPAWKQLPGNTDAAVVQFRKVVEDPNFARSLEHLESTLARLDRITGGGDSDLRATIDNLRQITDNLRVLTENAKRYPSQLLLGAPPEPAKGLQP